ncbi:MAG: hypothetical protein IKE22_08490, partial [Atopobiaceae bacterium]|nr:hypothetical protein [Atopobiaceae bacterium]
MASIICTTCFAILICIGVSSNAQAKQSSKALEFTDINVKTSSQTGFFVGHYASIEVSGWVTNKTGKPINADNMPSLVCGDEELPAKMSQEKLLADESCKVSFKGDVYLEDGKFPPVSFKGQEQFIGLETTGSQLDKELQKIAEEFSAEDAAREEERQKREQEEAAKKAKVEEEKASLLECEGKTALEAFDLAKTTSYEPYFEDAYGVGVTEDVRSANKDDEIAQALVTEVEPSDALWIFGATVTFKLDYTDPAAAKERQEKAEAEA